MKPEINPAQDANPIPAQQPPVSTISRESKPFTLSDFRAALPHHIPEVAALSFLAGFFARYLLENFPVMTTVAATGAVSSYAYQNSPAVRNQVDAAVAKFRPQKLKK